MQILVVEPLGGLTMEASTWVESSNQTGFMEAVANGSSSACGSLVAANQPLQLLLNATAGFSP